MSLPSICRHLGLTRRDTIEKTLQLETSPKGDIPNMWMDYVV